MWDKIIDLIEKFCGKYFISSLLALLTTIIIKYLTPDNFDPLKKLGNEFYFLGVFLAIFLIVELIKFIYQKTINKISYIKIKKENDEIKIQRNIKEIKDYIDMLSPEERKMVNFLLKNNNEPMLCSGYNMGYGGYGRIEYVTNTSEIIVEDKTLSGVNPYTYKKENYGKGSHVTMIKLDDDFYEQLKYMQEKNIGISNFK